MDVIYMIGHLNQVIYIVTQTMRIPRNWPIVFSSTPRYPKFLYLIGHN